MTIAIFFAIVNSNIFFTDIWGCCFVNTIIHSQSRRFAKAYPNICLYAIILRRYVNFTKYLILRRYINFTKYVNFTKNVVSTKYVSSQSTVDSSFRRRGNRSLPVEHRVRLQDLQQQLLPARRGLRENVPVGVYWKSTQLGLLLEA